MPSRIMRETIKSEAFYSNVVLEINETIDDLSNDENEFPENFPRTMRLAFHFSTSYQRKIIAMYSRGDAIDDIKPIYLEFLENFESLINIAEQDIDYVRDQYGFSLDKYYRIMSWAILFDIDLKMRKDFIIDLDFFGQQKTGDIMLQKAGLLDRAPVERLGGKPAYEPLLQALEANTAAEQAEKLKQFLTHWYGALKKMNVAWIDDHKSQHDVHFGYWCFEAAAAVKVLQLDPEVFKDMPYFPYDLVSR